MTICEGAYENVTTVEPLISEPGVQIDPEITVHGYYTNVLCKIFYREETYSAFSFFAIVAKNIFQIPRNENKHESRDLQVPHTHYLFITLAIFKENFMHETCTNSKSFYNFIVNEVKLYRLIRSKFLLNSPFFVIKS